MHPSGIKDYEWRITTMDRAIDIGFDDIGMGMLLGLYDFHFEALALIQHAKYLEERFGFGPAYCICAEAPACIRRCYS